MKVKSLLKFSMCNKKIRVMEPIKVEGQDERLIDHDVEIATGRTDVRRITDTWIEYSHVCFLPKSLVDKEVDMVATDLCTGALVIYTK